MHRSPMTFDRNSKIKEGARLFDNSSPIGNVYPGEKVFASDIRTVNVAAPLVLKSKPPLNVISSNDHALPSPHLSRKVFPSSSSNAHRGKEASTVEVSFPIDIHCTLSSSRNAVSSPPDILNGDSSPPFSLDTTGSSDSNASSIALSGNSLDSECCRLSIPTDCPVAVLPSSQSSFPVANCSVGVISHNLPILDYCAPSTSECNQKSNKIISQQSNAYINQHYNDHITQQSSDLISQKSNNLILANPNVHTFSTQLGSSMYSDTSSFPSVGYSSSRGQNGGICATNPQQSFESPTPETPHQHESEFTSSSFSSTVDANHGIVSKPSPLYSEPPRCTEKMTLSAINVASLSPEGRQAYEMHLQAYTERINGEKEVIAEEQRLTDILALCSSQLEQSLSLPHTDMSDYVNSFPLSVDSLEEPSRADLLLSDRRKTLERQHSCEPNPEAHRPSLSSVFTFPPRHRSGSIKTNGSLALLVSPSSPSYSPHTFSLQTNPQTQHSTHFHNARISSPEPETSLYCVAGESLRNVISVASAFSPSPHSDVPDVGHPSHTRSLAPIDSSSVLPCMSNCFHHHTHILPSSIPPSSFQDYNPLSIPDAKQVGSDASECCLCASNTCANFNYSNERIFNQFVPHTGDTFSNQLEPTTCKFLSTFRRVPFSSLNSSTDTPHYLVDKVPDDSGTIGRCGEKGFSEAWSLAISQETGILLECENRNLIMQEEDILCGISECNLEQLKLWHQQAVTTLADRTKDLAHIDSALLTAFERLTSHDHFNPDIREAINAEVQRQTELRAGQRLLYDNIRSETQKVTDQLCDERDRCSNLRQKLSSAQHSPHQRSSDVISLLSDDGAIPLRELRERVEAQSRFCEELEFQQIEKEALHEEQKERLHRNLLDSHHTLFEHFTCSRRDGVVEAVIAEIQQLELQRHDILECLLRDEKRASVISRRIRAHKLSPVKEHISACDSNADVSHRLTDEADEVLSNEERFPASDPKCSTKSPTLRGVQFECFSPTKSFDEGSSTVQLRSNKRQRPPTVFMPAFSPEFDLRDHLEGNSHVLENCNNVFVDSLTCKGYLSKLSGRFRTWKRRWFVFDRSMKSLLYYSERSTETRSSPKARILFQNIRDVYRDHGRNLSFCIRTNDKLFTLSAPSKLALRIWIDAVATGAEGRPDYWRQTMYISEESAQRNT